MDIALFSLQMRKLKFREVKFKVAWLVNESRFQPRQFQLLKPLLSTGGGIQDPNVYPTVRTDPTRREARGEQDRRVCL